MTSRHLVHHVSLLLQKSHYNLALILILFHFFLVLFAPYRTNIDSLQVLSITTPKQDRVYTRGRSKSIAPYASLVIGSDDKRDLENVPPGTSTPSRVARAARATPKKVASGVVSASSLMRSAHWLAHHLGQLQM